MGTSGSKDAAVIEEVSHVMLEEIDDEKESIYGSRFQAKSLWIYNKCAIILIVRRPGCPLCREQAQILAKMVERLATHLTYKDDLSISLSAVVSEVQYEQDIQDFKSYFKLDCRSELCQFGNVFYDPDKGFFKAQGYRKASLATLLTKKVRAAISRATGKGIKGTLNGEGTVLGGLLVISSDKIWYEYREEFFGDELRLPEILKAIGAATGKDFEAEHADEITTK